ncbi:Ldh family oxidoreductase [Amphritea sp. HPY]|uniref:Ldh family oxidoreductase n=1 Tax=Amphritea sp. HPY TaxID=3421652 RepID=UPI003D7D6EBF
MSATETRTESIHFLEYAIKRVWMAAGASETHADYVATAIGFGHRQGKLNQGLGVYECIDLCLIGGGLDIKAVPEVVSEGPAWAVVDGKRSSGYYALNVMADLAIEKARTSGIAIVYGGNHYDAGSFSAYVYKAYEQNMMAMASNNTVPLAAPFGGMENQLSCPPFDSIAPSGEQPPVWTSIKFGEFYDADIAESVLQQKPMKGKWCIDPETGETTDDARPYAKPIEGYGRLWDYTCAGQIETPRVYALNMWNEMMTAIVNPLGVPSTQLPTIDDFEQAAAGEKEVGTSVGGSYFMCINPAVFGSIDAMKQRSDAYVDQIKGCKPRPGHSVRVPGESGYKSLQQGDDQIEVLTNHWEPFFDTIASRYGLSEAQLRAEFEAADPSVS